MKLVLIMITPTTAFSKIGKLKAPVRVIQGGTSAGKPIQYYNTNHMHLVIKVMC
jgi:hypothetical protein